MIVMARVDDRLIHGQVAVKWCKQLDVNRIIVASDTVAENKLQVAALKAAAPQGIKVAVLSNEKAASIINDPRAAALRILLISNDPKSILIVLEATEERPTVDIANYGRMNGVLNSKKKISESVYLTRSDEEVIGKLSDLGVRIIHQPLPADSEKDFMALMKN